MSGGDTAENLKIGRILSVALDRSKFTVQKYGGFTAIKGSPLKRTDLHPDNCCYRPIVTDKGKEYLKTPQKVTGPTTRKRRNLDRGEPVKAQVPIGHILLAFRKLATSERLRPQVRNYLRETLNL